MPYDFCGWASRNNLKCSDGRTIRKDAFKFDDGKKVPLVWNHQHNSVEDVLGHAILENRPEGVFAYGSFNNSPKGKTAKEAVLHGDVTSMSIWANNLRQEGGDVLHGVIREVSLVLAGANPGAFIESVMNHAMPMDEDDEEGIFYTGTDIEVSLGHAEPENENPKKDQSGEGQEKEEKTVVQVFNTLNEEQKTAVAIVVGQAIKDAKGEQDQDDEEEEEEEMAHNLFENGGRPIGGYLSHSDFEKIMSDARQLRSFKLAIKHHLEEGGVLYHALDTTGMDVATGTQEYGINDMEMLFPDYKSINETPEFISRNMDWVQKVMSGARHTPFSRVKTLFADITEDEARAKGYMKGNMKKEEFFTTLKRTTEAQTVYKKQKLDRDDLLEVTGFDVIAWLRSEMRMMLDEDLARAILIGDGRPADSEDKIKEDRIRPIASDVPLFNTVTKIPATASTTDDEKAKAFIRAAVKARKNYKGSGNPTLFTTEDVLTDMLLLEDLNGHKLYKTEVELATALRVSSIVTVEPMENHELTIESKKYPLLGIIVNMGDYNIGANKGGEITWFDDFDIDYNQQKYLVETRCSGALVKPYSALTFVLDKGSAGGAATTAQTKSAKVTE